MLLLYLIGNRFATLFRMAMESWALVLFMAGLNSVFEMVHTSGTKIAEENDLPRVLEKRVCLLVQAISTANKQLL